MSARENSKKISLISSLNRNTGSVYRKMVTRDSREDSVISKERE